MLSQVAVQQLAGLTADLSRQTARRRIGHIAHPLAGDGQKAGMRDGTEDVGEHA